MDLNKRFNWDGTVALHGHGWNPVATAATDDSVATDGGAGVARACVEKIPIDNPTPVKMPNGGIDMLGCVG